MRKTEAIVLAAAVAFFGVAFTGGTADAGRGGEGRKARSVKSVRARQGRVRSESMRRNVRRSRSRTRSRTRTGLRRMRRTRTSARRRAETRNKGARLDRKTFPYLAGKYERLSGRHRGFYSGEGHGGKQYKLPRRVDPKVDGTRYAHEFKRVFENKRAFQRRGIEPGSMKLHEFLGMIEATVPKDVTDKIDATIDKAIELGDKGLARKFPRSERAKIRHALLYSWLHSRDMTVIQSALGYPLDSTGKHDIEEYAPAEAIIEMAKEPGRSKWLKNYAATLKPGEQVNISFMNPHWLADIWVWTPGDKNASQDAMDAHRKSDHHNGIGNAWDPVEAAVNNVFHRREHVYGVRKEAKSRWVDLGQKLETAAGAKEIAKHEIGAGIARDTGELMQKLEAEGKITPWYLVDPKSLAE